MYEIKGINSNNNNISSNNIESDKTDDNNKLHFGKSTLLDHDRFTLNEKSFGIVHYQPYLSRNNQNIHDKDADIVHK